MSEFLKNLMDKPDFSIPMALKALETGANPDTLNTAGDSLLHLLLARKIYPDLITIDQIVTTHKANIHIKNSAGKTPLQYLIDCNIWQSSDAYYLVRLGADPNTEDSKKQPLIHRIITLMDSNSMGYVEQLVKKFKVDINTLNGQHKTPLESLIAQQYWTGEHVLSLVKLGASPHTKDAKGNPLIHRILERHNVWSFGLDDKYVINALVRQYGADINATDCLGKTVFQHFLDQQISYKHAELFLELGAEPTTTDFLGDSVLFKLLKEKDDYSVIIKKLIALYRTILDVKNKERETLFTHAMHLLKNGHGHPANIIPIVVNSADFINKLNTGFQSQGKNITELNGIFFIAHKSRKPQSYELQGTIRSMAFQAFIESLHPLNAEQKLERLSWAKNQPIFKEHRSHFFFATMGRTNTVIQIENMIEEVKSQLDAAPAAKIK